MTCVQDDLGANLHRPAQVFAVAYVREELFARLGAELDARPGCTLTELAARLGVHRHTITTIVRERTGVPFRAWRARRLMDRACLLLQQRGTRSIKEISSLAGFNSTRSFDRFVKRHTGCRPSELAKGQVGCCEL